MLPNFKCSNQNWGMQHGRATGQGAIYFLLLFIFCNLLTFSIGPKDWKTWEKRIAKHNFCRALISYYSYPRASFCLIDYGPMQNDTFKNLYFHYARYNSVSCTIEQLPFKRHRVRIKRFLNTCRLSQGWLIISCLELIIAIIKEKWLKFTCNTKGQWMHGLLCRGRQIRKEII